MARTITLANLRTAVRYRTDTENDPHIVDAELNTYINSSLAEYDDLLFDSGLAFKRSTATLSYTAGVAALPADFLGLIDVWWEVDATRRARLKEIHPRDIWKLRKTANGRAYRYEVAGANINLYPPPPAGQTYTLVYVPCASTLAADGDTLDGYNGWEEYVIVDAARKVALKMDHFELANALSQSKQELKDRIRTASQNRSAASATSLYEEPSEEFEDFAWLWGY